MGIAAPTVGDCGRRLRFRTRDDASGSELGTFNAGTTPTGDEVEQFIADAVIELNAMVPEDVDLPESVAQYATMLATVRACMLIELRLGADPGGDDPDTTYQRLATVWDAGTGTGGRGGRLDQMLKDAGLGRQDGGRLVTVDAVTPWSGDDSVTDII